MRMQRVIHRIVALMLVSLCMLVSTGCASTTEFSDSEHIDTGIIGPRIRIGIPLDQPALSIRAGSTYSGFTVDVAQYVAKQLGYAPWQIEWVEAQPKALEQLFQEGNIDIAAGLFVPDSQLEQIKEQVNILLAGAYARDDESILAIHHQREEEQHQDITVAQDILGKVVCTVSAEDLTKQQWPGMTHVIQQPSVMQCATALMSGMADAVVAPRIALTGIAHTSLEDAVSGRNAQVLTEALDTGAYYMVVKTGANTLQSRIALALEHMVQTGTWQEVTEHVEHSTGVRVGLPQALQQQKKDA